MGKQSRHVEQSSQSKFISQTGKLPVEEGLEEMRLVGLVGSLDAVDGEDAAAVCSIKVFERRFIQRWPSLAVVQDLCEQQWLQCDVLLIGREPAGVEERAAERREGGRNLADTVIYFWPHAA